MARIKIEDLPSTALRPKGKSGIKLLLTGPFPGPVAPTYLDHRRELAPLLAAYGIRLVDDPGEADWEVCGYLGAVYDGAHRLPRERTLVLDGEPPQPEHLPAVYLQTGFASVLCPANGKAFAPDGLAFWHPAERGCRRPSRKNPRIVQLATFRSRAGNADGGLSMEVYINGTQRVCCRVLCNQRARVGLAIKQARGELIDIYGRGWPAKAQVVEDSRQGDQWYGRKERILASYGFDLCWENMEIPAYATEKIWQPIRAGVLPLYWGTPDVEAMLPADSAILCRHYAMGNRFQVSRLIQDLEDMTEQEYLRRVNALCDWYENLPRDAHRQSWLQAARLLAEEVCRLHYIRGPR